MISFVLFLMVVLLMMATSTQGFQTIPGKASKTRSPTNNIATANPNSPSTSSLGFRSSSIADEKSINGMWETFKKFLPESVQAKINGLVEIAQPQVSRPRFQVRLKHPIAIKDKRYITSMLLRYIHDISTKDAEHMVAIAISEGDSPLKTYETLETANEVANRLKHLTPPIPAIVVDLMKEVRGDKDLFEDEEIDSKDQKLEVENNEKEVENPDSKALK